MRKWFIIFLITFSAYLSGFTPVGKSDQLFLRNISNLNTQNKSVKGTASQNTKNKYINSQVEELSIGAVKYTAPTPIPQPTGKWGTARQIDEHTWTIKVGEDEKIGTAQEILTALNNYRQRSGRGALSWDDGLANYANSRSSYFNSVGKLDGHAGFSDYVNNQDGFQKLGFMSLGENSSYGYTLEGVHLIEWVYAGDKPHDDNQLDSKWSHVGVGVSGTATDLIFGGKKM